MKSKRTIAAMVCLSTCATCFYVYAFANLKDHPIEVVAVEDFDTGEDAFDFAKGEANSEIGEDSLFELTAATKQPSGEHGERPN